MAPLDRMIVSEYLSEQSDFKKAAVAVDKIYDGLMKGLYKVALADFEIETQLRKLHQRIMELNNAAKRSEKNEKKLIKEIDKLRIDPTGLRTNLIEFLLKLRNRVNNFNGIYDRTCKEYGVNLKKYQNGKSILRWDHMRPDPSTVLGSLQYIEDYSTEIEEFRKKCNSDIKDISEELGSLGVSNLSGTIAENANFQELRHEIDSIMGKVDINGLCDLARIMGKFFNLASEIFSNSDDTDPELEVNAKLGEDKLNYFRIGFVTRGKCVYPKLPDITVLATQAADDTPCINTNVSEISAGLENLKNLLTNLKRIDLCLPLSRSFMIKLSKYEKYKETSVSETFTRFAIRIPVSLEETTNLVNVAGVFKIIVKSLELGARY